MDRWSSKLGIAPKLSETPGQVRHRAPYAGEHTDEVLRSLGYEASVIAEYREQMVVGVGGRLVR